jgi:hypothetical protein
MSTTLEHCKQYLDHRQWTYQTHDQTLLTSVTLPNHQTLPLVIRVSENGEYLQLQAPQLYEIKEHHYKGIIFQSIASIQYQYKLLRLEYDIRDGEIRAAIELPLEDTELSQRQFDRCLDSLIYLTTQIVQPRLNAILASGEDPGTVALAQQLLEQLPPQIVRDLQQLLSDRQPDNHP